MNQVRYAISELKQGKPKSKPGLYRNHVLTVGGGKYGQAENKLHNQLQGK